MRYAVALLNPGDELTVEIVEAADVQAAVKQALRYEPDDLLPGDLEGIKLHLFEAGWLIEVKEIPQ